MQVIIVKMFPITNTKPVQFQAVTTTGIKGPVTSLHKLDPFEDRYPVACTICANNLARTLGWKGEWIGGELSGSDYMVFVPVHPQANSFTVV